MDHTSGFPGNCVLVYPKLMLAGVLLLALVCVRAQVVAQSTANIELLSVNATGDHAGNGASSLPQSSANGRLVVFTSTSSDLVLNDTNNAADVFVRDLQQNTTTLVSVNSAGTAAGNGPSSDAFVTPDGNHVVFLSEAGNLVAGDTNGKKDVFVRDLGLHKTTLVSVNAAGTNSGDGESFGARITPDGRYVVFTTSAKDLVSINSNQTFTNVLRRDLSAGTTVLASVNAANTSDGNGHSFAPAISSDGRYVLFASAATDLISNDTNGVTNDFFRRDVQAGTTALVTVNRAGSGSSNGPAVTAVMSDDGKVVAFSSRATDLVVGDENVDGISVYARDFTTNTTTRINEKPASSRYIYPASSPRISSDGRYVFYVATFISLFVPNSPDDRVIRSDRLTQERLSLFAGPGICSQGASCLHRISNLVASPDGRHAAYKQVETRFTDNRLTTVLILHDAAGGFATVFGDNVNGMSELTLSPGNIVSGLKVFFSSGVSHSSKDTNTAEDVYSFAPPEQSSFALETNNTFMFEGSQSQGTYVVRRTGLIANSTATVDFATAGGTATAGSDYQPVSGTLIFQPGEISKTIAVPIIDDDIVEPEETLNLTLSNATGTAVTLGSPSSLLLTIVDNDEYILNFSSRTASASETAGRVTVTVALSGGSPHPPIDVFYSTFNDTASDRSDYKPELSRQLVFAANEETKTITILLTDDAYLEAPEVFHLELEIARGAKIGNFPVLAITILSDDLENGPNPVRSTSFDAGFFVRQHYLDFLGREPDAAGLAFWTNQITECEQRPEIERQGCREARRINVSAAFFLSIEFQQTGYLVYLANQAAFNVGEQLRLRSNFLPLTQDIGRGVVIGEPGADELLEQNRRLFFNQFIERSDFRNAYPPSMMAAQFVDALNLNTANSLSPVQRDALVNGLAQGTLTRAQVLRAICENEAFRVREFNRAFVLMQYFGYLRRTPDDAPDINFNGYNFWLAKLNQFRGNFQQAEMVKAFINSEEYKLRFGR